jgi:uncharacterized protein YajQ (UPF0234 family)
VIKYYKLLIEICTTAQKEQKTYISIGTLHRSVQKANKQQITKAPKKSKELEENQLDGQQIRVSKGV